VSLAPYYNPGELVPATGRFVLTNVFGTAIGDSTTLHAGDTFGPAPRGFHWQAVSEPAGMTAARGVPDPTSKN
jgi:hypothetical protein